MSNSPVSIFGYWASQEQYSMQDLLMIVTKAEHSGFKTWLTSDHFHLWWHNNGYSNFTNPIAEWMRPNSEYLRDNFNSSHA
jgi:alkanesulfonate monooxygenase SsuD/methylene tetrahydromethanopterin reductase-like flavin-dependent oxidoreductase (luciferase family)